jgi:hypothetical protein
MTPEHHDEKGAGEILGNGRSPGPASLELFIDAGDGDEAPCRLSLQWVKQRVTFMDFDAVRAWCRQHD